MRDRDTGSAEPSMLRRLLALSVIAIAFAGCASAPGCGGAGDSGRCLRILFIGNSFTQVNDLPGTFAAMARAGGYHVETAIAAEGGAALEDQLNSADTLAKLGGSKWDFVVLQEQSQLPAVEAYRRVQMYPAARRLVATIAATGARPMFFMTWGHRDGWPENGLPTYESMQAQIAIGYLTIARELNVPVAPVGSAWLAVARNYSSLDLWQADGVHPSELGTYLAASVFYAAIFQRSPAGSNYVGTLPAATAQILQAVAGQTVLANPGQWNLP